MNSRRRSQSRSWSQSRSPRDRRVRSRYSSNRDAPLRSEARRSFRHIASECTTQARCWNCRETGHVASNCHNVGSCHTCGKAWHRARDCPNSEQPGGELRLCNNCYKPGHIAVDCTNDKACKNCRKTGHIARDCRNEPVCNVCNISGHVARQCPKGNSLDERSGRVRYGGYRDAFCRNCNQFGHELGLHRCYDHMQQLWRQGPHGI